VKSAAADENEECKIENVVRRDEEIQIRN